VPAAGQPELVAADPDPLEVRRRGQHRLQQLGVAALDGGATIEVAARLADPGRELVAQPLQLAEIEKARLGGDRGHAMGDHDPPEPLRQQPAQLALQARHLPPQLVPGAAFAGADLGRRQSLSCEQVRHRPPLRV
jgi:hypothetical protein